MWCGYFIVFSGRFSDGSIVFKVFMFRWCWIWGDNVWGGGDVGVVVGGYDGERIGWKGWIGCYVCGEVVEECKVGGIEE